jgi:1-acyl-sn-glycerol-3-phosphate acyltransferase
VNPSLYRAVAHVLDPLARALYRHEVVGAERIPESGPCIVVANHESVIDPLVLGVAAPRPLRFMAKAELWESRLLGSLVEALGGFPVRRSTGDRETTAIAIKLLAAGEALAIFPQGTCMPHRRRPLGRGAAKLALVTGAPLVPVCLLRTESAVRPYRVRLGRPDLLTLVGSPIRVERERPTIQATRALTARVDAALNDLRRPYGEPAHAWIV